MLLPASLLREVDQLVLSGQGGYESRQEFFAEAIENQVLEVKHGATAGGQLLLSRELGRELPAQLNAHTPQSNGELPAAPDQRHEPPSLPGALADGEPIHPITEISKTALPPVTRGAILDSGMAVFKKEPLFGLHNRDYPSVWALAVAARMTASGPVAASEVYAEVTREAWRFANSLTDLEKRVPGKLTALFPTNTAKPQSAEEGFRAFALGAINRKLNAEGSFEAAGPFFSWQVVQLIKGTGGTPSLAVTTAGWDLLDAMAGLTLAWPHDRKHAEQFFMHLRRHAPWDWAGFEQLLAFVQERPNRMELAAHFGRWQPTWSEAMRNTNAAGFVARAREWGLLETKLIDGRYVLTEFGELMHTQRSDA